MNCYLALIVAGILVTNVGCERLSAAEVVSAPVYSVAEIAFARPHRLAGDTEMKMPFSFRTLSSYFRRTSL